MKSKEENMATGSEQPGGIDPKKIPIAQFWKACMSVVILPIHEWDQAIYSYFVQKLQGRLSPMWAVSILIHFKPQLIAQHYRLARAVQCTGQILDPLAAPIGAIRLRDKNHAKTAAEYIGQQAVKAFEAGDNATLARIKRLSSIPLRKHRNFQVWVAIDELVGKQAGSVASTMPDTVEIRRYVEKHSDDPSFDDLPGPKDHKGWTRLWGDSGAELIIPKGVKGKKGRRL
jgi:hypothetical protein